MPKITYTVGVTDVTTTLEEAKQLRSFIAHAAHEMKFNSKDRLDRQGSFGRVSWKHYANTDIYEFYVDDVCVFAPVCREQAIAFGNAIQDQIKQYMAERTLVAKTGDIDLSTEDRENALNVVAHRYGTYPRIELKTTVTLEDALDEHDELGDDMDIVDVVDLELSVRNAKLLVKLLNEAIRIVEDED